MEAGEVSEILAAVGHPNRLAILCCLAPYSQDADDPGLAAGEIARRLNMAPATLSFHLKDMTFKGLVEQRRQGRHIHYKVSIPRLLESLEYVVVNVCEAGRET